MRRRVLPDPDHDAQRAVDVAYRDRGTVRLAQVVEAGFELRHPPRFVAAAETACAGARQVGVHRGVGGAHPVSGW